ncbi:MAG: PH domain-containing protein [Candidatus Kariarchaeaceae archaeon]|jgi:membrane protein YdbS with pleckstrin-like domain
MNNQQYTKPFSPQLALRTKYILYVLTVGIGVWAIFNFFAAIIIKTDPTLGWPRDYMFAVFYSTGLILVFILLTTWFAKAYYHSIFFEIVEDEVHVNRGIITKTRKIVPYRTITNVEIKRGPYDRLLGLGTIELQTAGFSSNKMGPEERLDGLPANELDIIQSLIINQVRNVRGSPATSHDLDTPKSEDVLVGILNEVMELKKILLTRNE